MCLAEIASGEVVDRTTVLQQVAEYDCASVLNTEAPYSTARFPVLLPGTFPKNLSHAKIRCQHRVYEC